jgi:uncharacterized protein
LRPGGLIDTGAIVAVVDVRDRWHQACQLALQGLRLPLATTEAVLAETFYVLERHEAASAWRFIRSGAVTILPIADNDLLHLERLMLKYADRPMDFADATLVHVAERERLTTILTTDRDFAIYRIGGRKVFRLVPER